MFNELPRPELDEFAPAPAVGLTPLDTIETKGTPPSAPRLIHQNTILERDAAYKALSRCLEWSRSEVGPTPEHPDDEDHPGERVTQERLERFDACSNSAWLMRHNHTGQIRVHASRCKDRWCPTCANARRRNLYERIVPRLAELMRAEPAHPAKMLTLTIKHSRAPLKDQITHAKACWRRLARSAWFKRLCIGGFSALEVKLAKDKESWHVHLHAIVYARYIPAARLSDAWLKITGNSYVVDIRATRNGTEAAAYISKYISKPATLSDLTVDQGALLIEALKGVHMYSTWGVVRDAVRKGDEEDPTETGKEWTPLGTLSAIVQRALAYDAEALTWLMAARLLPPGSTHADLAHRLGVPGTWPRHPQRSEVS